MKKPLFCIVFLLFFTITAIYAQGIPPNLILPPDGIPGIPADMVELVWEQPGWIPMVSYFEVFLGQDPIGMPVYSGYGMELYNGNYFSFAPGGLASMQQYFWRVRVSDFPGGPFNESPTWMFTTAGSPPLPPVLVSPEDGAVNVPYDAALLLWQQPDYTVDSFFDVYCDPDPSFPGPPIFSGWGSEVVHGDGFGLCNPPLSPGIHYHWKVRHSREGMSCDAPRRTFTTTESPEPPEPAILWSPVNWETTVIPELIKLGWIKPAPMMPESFFDVYYSTVPEFPEPPVYTGPGIPDPEAGPDHYKYIIQEALFGQTYYWKVRFTDGDTGLSSESEVWQFTTATPPVPPVLVYPPDDTVNLIFRPDVEPIRITSPGGMVDSFFDVFMSIDPLFPGTPVYTGPGISDPRFPGEYVIPIPDLQDNQTYYWYARLTDQVTGLHSESDVWQFATCNALLPDIPELIYPPANVLLPPITFSAHPSVSFNVHIKPELLSYAWSFGDEEGPVEPPNHQYTPDSSGYVARCHVTDSDGDLEGESVTIDVDAGSAPVPLWILTEFGGQWYPAVPYPYTGQPGPVVLPPIPLENRGQYTFFIMVVAGEDYNPLQEPILAPGPTSNPNPPDGAVNVPTDIGQIQWEYHQLPGYGIPDGFEVYFPADSPSYTWVPYVRDTLYTMPIPHQQYNSPPLSFKAIARNAGGSAQNTAVWTFTTEPPPPPVLMSPANHASVVPINGFRLEWSFEPDGFIPPEGYYYEIFLWNLDRMTGAGIYSGPIAFDNPPYAHFEPGFVLEEATEYFWSVRVLVNGASVESEEWDFTTESLSLPAPVVAISPDGMLHWQAVSGAFSYNIYASEDPYGLYYLVGNTTELFWLDPNFPAMKGFYQVTALSAGLPPVRKPDAADR